MAQRTIKLTLAQEPLTLSKVDTQLYVDGKLIDVSKLPGDPREWTCTYLDSEEVLAEDLADPYRRFIIYISQLVHVEDSKLPGGWQTLLDELLWLLHNGLVPRDITIDSAYLQSKNICLPSNGSACLTYNFARAARILVS
jgi:hypothetical protein